ncbi:MAG: nucleoside kinase, partial [Ruthenibacterium sp.]
MGSSLIWIPKRLVELGLVNLAAQEPEAFVRYCEDDYGVRITHAADRIQQSGVRVVMLTGPSASGKTTTAHKLTQELCRRGQNAVVVSLDNFFKDIEEYPRLPDGTPDYESVDALDVKRINACLLELVQTGKTAIPNFDFHRERRGCGEITVQVDDGVVIAEGIHALNPRLIAALPKGGAYKIYAGLREEYSYYGQRVLPTRDVRLARRMVRDIKFRGHSIEKTMAMWPAVCDGEDRFIKVFKNEADLLLDTSFSYEVCALSPFVAEMRGRLSGDSAYAQPLEDLCAHFA